MAKKKKDISYIVTIFPDYSITGKEEKKEFKSKEDVAKFLEKNAYDSTDKEIVPLIEDGGDYKGLNDTEFTIEIIKPIEQNHFNNAEIFVEDFEDYLIGKETDYRNEKEQAGTYPIIKSVSANVKNNTVAIELSDIGTIELKQEDFLNFIEGNQIELSEGEFINLLLEPRVAVVPFNKPEYKYYVVCEHGKILSGHEYKEDAEKEKERKEKYGHNVDVKTRKELKELVNVDLDDNNSWSVNEHDWNIIQSAINFGVEEKDFSEAEGEKYFKGFKENGVYITLVKSLLLKALSMLQKQSWKAYSNSNIEKANEKNEIISRINKELSRVIEIEK